MDFITFFVLACVVILFVVFFGGLFIAGLPILVFVGIPLFLLWLLIYHTVAGMIVGVLCLAFIGLAKSGKS